MQLETTHGETACRIAGATGITLGLRSAQSPSQRRVHFVQVCFHLASHFIEGKHVNEWQRRSETVPNRLPSCRIEKRRNSSAAQHSAIFSAIAVSRLASSVLAWRDVVGLVAVGLLSSLRPIAGATVTAVNVPAHAFAVDIGHVATRSRPTVAGDVARGAASLIGRQGISIAPVCHPAKS